VSVAFSHRRPLAVPRCPSQTDAAALRLKNLMSGRPEALGVRVGVKTRGCNGMSYTLNWVEEEPARAKFADSVSVDGIRVFIEPRALLTIIGTTMDFQSDDLREGFVFENPQATDVCGCGESFTLGNEKPSITGSAPPTASGRGSGAPPTSGTPPSRSPTGSPPTAGAAAATASAAAPDRTVADLGFLAAAGRAGVDGAAPAPVL